MIFDQYEAARSRAVDYDTHMIVALGFMFFPVSIRRGDRGRARVEELLRQKTQTALPSPNIYLFVGRNEYSEGLRNPETLFSFPLILCCYKRAI